MSGKHAKAKRETLKKTVDKGVNTMLKGVGDVMGIVLAERVMADPARFEGGLEAFKRGDIRLDLDYRAQAGKVTAVGKAVSVATGEVLAELFRYPPAA